MTSSIPDSDRRQAGKLAAAFGLLLALIVGLMTLGALVRAHEAGLACPDWPLCFGEVIPQMDIKVAFEWSHRVLAGGISLVFLALSIATLRRPGLVSLRPYLVTTAVILAIQILLGALTVWQLLASWTVTSHLLTGNAFAIAVLFATLRLREIANPGQRRPRASGLQRGLIAGGALLLLIQVALGGLVSSTFAGLACPEWPTCNGGQWFPSWGGSVGLHLLHRSNGYALWLLLGISAVATWGVPGLRGLTSAAFVLASLQVLVGIANVVLSLPVEVTGSHSFLAAVLGLNVAAAVRGAFRNPSGAAVPGL